MIGWILLGLALGAVATAAIVTFWEEIATWLNNVAADAVEKTLGYKARQNMFKATAVVDKIVNQIRNRTTVFSKKDRLSTTIEKTVLESRAYTNKIDPAVLKEIEIKGQLVQELGYRN